MQGYIRPWVTVLFGWVRERRDLVLGNAAFRQVLLGKGFDFEALGDAERRDSTSRWRCTR